MRLTSPHAPSVLPIALMTDEKTVCCRWVGVRAWVRRVWGVC